MNKKNRDRLIEFGILGAIAGFAKGIDEVIAAGNNLAERLRSLDWWGGVSFVR